MACRADGGQLPSGAETLKPKPFWFLLMQQSRGRLCWGMSWPRSWSRALAKSYAFPSRTVSKTCWPLFLIFCTTWKRQLALESKWPSGTKIQKGFLNGRERKSPTPPTLVLLQDPCQVGLQHSEERAAPTWALPYNVPHLWQTCHSPPGSGHPLGALGGGPTLLVSTAVQCGLHCRSLDAARSQSSHLPLSSGDRTVAAKPPLALKRGGLEILEPGVEGVAESVHPPNSLHYGRLCMPFLTLCCPHLKHTRSVCLTHCTDYRWRFAEHPIELVWKGKSIWIPYLPYTLPPPRPLQQGVTERKHVQSCASWRGTWTPS